MLAFPSPSALVSHKLLLHSSPSLSSLSSPSSCSSSALLCVVEALPSSCCSTFQASFRRCGNSKFRAASSSSSSSSSKVPFPSYRSVEAASSACCYSKNYEGASLSSSSCSKLGARLSLNSRPPHPLQSYRQGVSYGSLRKMRSPCSSLCLLAPNEARYAEKFLCGIWWWQLGKNRRGRVQASVPLPQPLRFIRRAFLSRLLTYSSNFSDIDPVQLSELWVKTLKVSRDPRKILKAFHHSFVFVVVLAQVENDISGSTSSTKIIGVGRAVSDGAFIATICDVAVDPEYQKRGIGRRIVKQLVQDMKRKGGPTGYAVFPPKASWRFFWMIGFRFADQIGSIDSWHTGTKKSLLQAPVLAKKTSAETLEILTVNYMGSLHSHILTAGMEATQLPDLLQGGDSNPGPGEGNIVSTRMQCSTVFSPQTRSRFAS